VADQLLLSVATFLLTVVAGRSLGPSGLGVVAVGMAAALLPIGLSRALITDPYVTRSEISMDDRDAFASAVSLTLTLGMGAAAVFIAIGAVSEGAVAEGLIAYGPWIPLVLLQAFLRTAAYRHGKSRAAMASATSWLTAEIGMLALLHGTSGPAGLVAAWGVGAGVGLAVLLPYAVRPASLRAAIRWGRKEAFGLGRWLAASTLVHSAGYYALFVGLSSLLGPSAVGGYRAIESVFSPLSLLAPGLSNPGVRTMQLRRDRDQRLLPTALAIGGVASVLTLTFSAALWFSQDLVFAIYGEEFATYSSLIPPIALQQILLASGIGFSLLLRVMRRGSTVFVTALLNSTLVALVALSVASGSSLASTAWAIAVATIPAAAWVALRALVVDQVRVSVRVAEATR
jgi:O-antigen/teichoic acid export membrane protein